MFDWKPAYSVNIASIDAQHQKLLAIGSELFNAMTRRQGQAITGEILDRLIQYTASHFAQEEQLMRQHGYPGFAEHKAQHDALVKKVLQFQADFKAGRVAVSIQVLDFLKSWLIGHIQGSDTKYAPYVREKSAA